MATNRDLCAFFFKPQGEGVHRSKICGADRKHLPGTANLLSHLSSRHENFRAQYNCGVVISRRLLTTISEQGQYYLQVAQATNPRSCGQKQPRGARDSTRSLPKARRCSVVAKMSFKAGCPYY
ncbi:hypothetical protein PC120_g21407 [Phytophthora cactorum]|nr:hypothetical protein PC120_g21407 [Phytophthora cactorum]